MKKIRSKDPSITIRLSLTEAKRVHAAIEELFRDRGGPCWSYPNGEIAQLDHALVGHINEHVGD